MPTPDTMTGCPVDHSAMRQPEVIPSTELPGSTLPLIAQLWKYRTLRTVWLSQLRTEHGHRFRMNFRPKAKIYLISDPDDVKAMFLAPRDVLHTGNGSDILEKFFGGTGLAFLDEEAHLARRKALMPSIKGEAFKRIEAAAIARAKHDVAKWPREEIISVHPHAHRYTIEVIREVVFGRVTPSSWDDLGEEIFQVMEFNNHLATVLMFERAPRPVTWLLRAIRSTGVDHFLRHRERADELLFEAIEERRSSDDLGDDMLSMLLRITHDDGSALSTREIRDEVMTMFVAGTETTASAICWALEYLSREPEVAQRVRAELDEGAGDAYLTAVVYELLRVRPPLPMIILRKVMKPLEIGGVRYEVGDELFASAHLLNHDPNHYDDAEAFRPERFLDVKPGANTWIPFGGGAIRCLGDRIAITEIKAVLSNVLSTCELRREDTTPERTRSRGVLIVPENDARLELVPRTADLKLVEN